MAGRKRYTRAQMDALNRPELFTNSDLKIALLDAVKIIMQAAAEALSQTYERSTIPPTSTSPTPLSSSDSGGRGGFSGRGRGRPPRGRGGWRGGHYGGGAPLEGGIEEGGEFRPRYSRDEQEGGGPVAADHWERERDGRSPPPGEWRKDYMRTSSEWRRPPNGGRGDRPPSPLPEWAQDESSPRKTDDGTGDFSSLSAGTKDIADQVEKERAMLSISSPAAITTTATTTNMVSPDSLFAPESRYSAVDGGLPKTATAGETSRLVQLPPRSKSPIGVTLVTQPHKQEEPQQQQQAWPQPMSPQTKQPQPLDALFAAMAQNAAATAVPTSPTAMPPFPFFLAPQSPSSVNGMPPPTSPTAAAAAAAAQMIQAQLQAHLMAIAQHHAVASKNGQPAPQLVLPAHIIQQMMSHQGFMPQMPPMPQQPFVQQQPPPPQQPQQQTTVESDETDIEQLQAALLSPAEEPIKLRPQQPAAPVVVPTVASAPQQQPKSKTETTKPQQQHSKLHIEKKSNNNNKQTATTESIAVLVEPTVVAEKAQTKAEKKGNTEKLKIKPPKQQQQQAPAVPVAAPVTIKKPETVVPPGLAQISFPPFSATVQPQQPQQQPQQPEEPKKWTTKALPVSIPLSAIAAEQESLRPTKQPVAPVAEETTIESKKWQTQPAAVLPLTAIVAEQQVRRRRDDETRALKELTDKAIAAANEKKEGWADPAVMFIGDKPSLGEIQAVEAAAKAAADREHQKRVERLMREKQMQEEERRQAIAASNVWATIQPVPVEPIAVEQQHSPAPKTPKAKKTKTPPPSTKTPPPQAAAPTPQQPAVPPMFWDFEDTTTTTASTTKKKETATTAASKSPKVTSPPPVSVSPAQKIASPWATVPASKSSPSMAEIQRQEINSKSAATNKPAEILPVVARKVAAEAIPAQAPQILPGAWAAISSQKQAKSKISAVMTANDFPALGGAPAPAPAPAVATVATTATKPTKTTTAPAVQQPVKQGKTGGKKKKNAAIPLSPDMLGFTLAQRDTDIREDTDI